MNKIKMGKGKRKTEKGRIKTGKGKRKTGKGKRKTLVKNILGTQLVPCGSEKDKKTGYYRNGICSNEETDVGTHVVCAVVDNDFLEFTKSKGNDLITPTLNFPGLVAGDKWCLCILRWIEAYKAGKAPKIIAESTNEIAKNYISKNILLDFSI
jgi:uncharacterized protein (DUF2237 family)